MSETVKPVFEPPIPTEAEEYARLKAEIERLRAALHYIAREQREDDKPHLIARAALKETSDD